MFRSGALFPPPAPAPYLSFPNRAVQYGDRMSAPQCQDVFTSLPRLGFEPSEYQVGPGMLTRGSMIIFVVPAVLGLSGRLT